MRRMTIRAVSALLAAAPMTASLWAADVNPNLPSATQALQAAYPGVQVYERDGMISALYGKPMTSGATLEEAVDAFWAQHRDAFGIQGLEVELQTSAALHSRRCSASRRRRFPQKTRSHAFRRCRSISA